MKNYQSILFPYAYNILGSAEDAKDAIQDVVLKYTDKKIQPEDEKNYLIKGVINQSINMKKKRKRVQTSDTWLPEPVSTEKSDLAVELKDLVSYSLLFLLERLNPTERAVFILKEAFAYTHQEIAEVLSITIENSRKLLSRARHKVKQPKPANADLHDGYELQFRSLDQLISAVREKDLETIHQLLSDDITYYADGGEKIKVVKRFCEGVADVADLIVLVHHRYQRKRSIKPAIVNHQPAFLFHYREKLTACLVFEFTEGSPKSETGLPKIKRISSIIDPAKLKKLAEQEKF